MIYCYNKRFQNSTRKFWEKTNTFRNVARHINTLSKSVAFVYINNKHNKKYIMETLIHNRSKQTKQKHVGIKLTKDGGTLQRKTSIIL